MPLGIDRCSLWFSDFQKQDSLWLRGILLGLVCVLTPLFQPALLGDALSCCPGWWPPVALAHQRAGLSELRCAVSKTHIRY